MATERPLIDLCKYAEYLKFIEYDLRQKSGFNEVTHCMIETLEYVRDIAMRQPIVDAVEVVHGHWIYEEEPDENNNIQARCSVCFAGDLHATALIDNVPYCWKCGAKMDGDTT